MSKKVEQALVILAAISHRDVGSIKPEQELSVDLGIDSPKGLELILELESQANIFIPDDEAARMITVNDLITFIEKNAH